jgi:hypothetical protein
MLRWVRVVVLAVWIGVGLAGGGLVVHAQEGDAAQRIEDAYDAYTTWDTYTVSLEDSASLALTAQGKAASLWQKQERNITLSCTYDRSDPDSPVALVTLNGNTEKSDSAGEAINTSTWTVDMEAALNGGNLFWRGSYTADPDNSFTLPDTWEEFAPRQAASIPALNAVQLNRYLLQEERDPFIGDYAAWLETADSITGPQSMNLDRTTPGDLYVITVPLAEVPALLNDYLDTLTGATDSIAERDTLLDSLLANSTLTWQIVLDPDTGRLLAHALQFDLFAELGSDALADPYSSLSLDFRDETSAFFSDVNEPVSLDNLPG